MRKLLTLVLGAMLGSLSLVAGATSVFDPLTTAVSFTDVTAALFTVAAAIVGVLVVIKGIRWVFKMIGAR